MLRYVDFQEHQGREDCKITFNNCNETLLLFIIILINTWELIVEVVVPVVEVVQVAFFDSLYKDNN